MSLRTRETTSFRVGQRVVGGRGTEGGAEDRKKESASRRGAVHKVEAADIMIKVRIHAIIQNEHHDNHGDERDGGRQRESVGQSESVLV